MATLKKTAPVANLTLPRYKEMDPQCTEYQYKQVADFIKSLYLQTCEPGAEGITWYELYALFESERALPLSERWIQRAATDDEIFASNLQEGCQTRIKHVHGQRYARHV